MNFRKYLETSVWDDESEESKSSVEMIKDLESLPRAQSWRGYPTWDFGDGVLISLTNQPRNLDTDYLFSSFMRPEDHPPNIWYVENISSSEKGSGNAAAAMQRLLRMADKNNITLRLYPKRTEKGKQNLTDKDLAKWYERLGFRKISNFYYQR